MKSSETLRHTKREIARHYGLNSVTDKQARDEVLSLSRKQDKGSLDDSAGYLVASIEIATGRGIGEVARVAYRDWEAS